MSNDIANLRELAKRADAATYLPGFPFGGTGEWAYNVDAMLGGPVGEYCAAIAPDVLLLVLDSLERLDGPCRLTRGQAPCLQGIDIDGWCDRCLARCAIEALTTPHDLNPSSPENAPGPEVITHPGASRDGEAAAPGCAPKNVP